MAIDNTVIAYSTITWSYGNEPTIRVLFDGGLCTATTFPLASGQTLPTYNQNVCKVLDVTGDQYSNTNNNHGGTYAAGPAPYASNRAIRYLRVGDCNCGYQNTLAGPPPVSGERTYSYELADDPGQATGTATVHTITVWVPGMDTAKDSAGNFPTQVNQTRGIAWTFTDHIDAYSAAITGHTIQGTVDVYDHQYSYAAPTGEHTDQTEGIEFVIKETSDPDNRFYGDVLFTGGLLTGTNPITFDTADFQTQYVSQGVLSGPTATDCTFPNPTTGSTSTSLRGIVAYDKYQYWKASKNLSASLGTSLYDEFVTVMSQPNIHSSGYTCNQLIGGATSLIETVPHLGGWAINSHQVSEAPATVPGCMDTNAQNYNSSATSDCLSHFPAYNTSCCWYCADPTALNYNSSSQLNCDGTASGTTATGWNTCCVYDTPTYGCTDPAALNYNSTASIDDGSCEYTEPETPLCSYSWSEACDNLGTADVTLDLTAGTSLKNVTSTYNSINTIHNTCTTNLTSIVLPLIATPGGVIDVEGECSFTLTDSYDPNINSIITGGTQPPLPSWALPTCGETVTTNTSTNFASDTDVYVWYDTSSWGTAQVISAYNAILDWLDVQASVSGWTGNVYHIISVNEKFIDWANYPMTGTIELGGSMGNTMNTACAQSSSVTFDKNHNFAKVSAWITHNNIPNWYHAANTKLKNATGNINVSKTADGSALVPTVNVPVQMINNATCLFNNGVGYTGPSTYAGTGNNGFGALPPSQIAGGNFLNVILLDEATDYNTGSSANTAYGNPPGPNAGYNTSSLTNQSTAATYKRELQVKPRYIIHYDAYVTSWKAWSGSARSFIYPTYPAGSPTNQHYGSSQLFGAMVFSGNKSTPDGHFTAGTANTVHPVSSSAFGKLTLFEDVTQGTRHNVFWDKPNSTHPSYGYGGLDNYGWGANVNMSSYGFTQTIFNSDLTTFLSQGPPITTTNTTATCDDSECVLFIVKDQNNNLLSGYNIQLDGVSIGTTNTNGELSHTIALASTLSNKLVNDCWTLDPVGACYQTKYELIVAKDSYTTNITCIGGCTDPLAMNYDPLATWDDGSCEYCVWGCMDPAALNYNPLATCDDGSCIIEGCTNVWATNYNPAANVDDGSCEFPGQDNECVPNNIYYDIINTKNCIAKFGTRYYKKLITGMDDDCSTLLIWQLIFIDYLLPKFELNCFYNCSDIGTPYASDTNQGGNSTDTTNYLDKFRTFVFKHCEDCFADTNTIGAENDVSPEGNYNENVGKGGNDDGNARDG